VSSYFADDWWEDKYPFCPHKYLIIKKQKLGKVLATMNITRKLNAKILNLKLVQFQGSCWRAIPAKKLPCEG
jgi:hypothetical protein